MKKYKELAILFKKIVDINKNIEFIPIKIIEGTYCQEDNCFIDKDGTPYYHIIENPDSYGYSNRDSILNYKNSYRHLSLSLIKMLELREAKKYTYSYNIDGETEAPLILFTKPNNPDKIAILKDDDIESIYEEKFPEFYSTYIDTNQDSDKEENQEKEELDIKKLYQELTSQIIDQDEAIKNVLSLIWKQIGDENNKTKNIIIEGNSKVGKSEIFKILSQKLNIPITTVTAKDYTIRREQYKSIEQIIIELIAKANYDIELAKKSILIIDKFEEVLDENVPLEVISELEKLLEGTNILVNSNIGSFEFDTSKLMIIALNNTQKQKKENKKAIGFDNKTNDNNNSSILEKFSKVIKMNELDYNSFIKILKSDSGILTSSKTFLGEKGVTLTVEEPAIELIAKKASKSIDGVKSLNEIIENALSVAEFEIANNPELYSELIITPETINDNKVYKLIRKKES